MTKYTPEGLPVVSLETTVTMGRDHNKDRSAYIRKVLDNLVQENPLLGELLEKIGEDKKRDGRSEEYQTFLTGFLLCYDYLRIQGEVNKLEEGLNL